MEGEDATAGTGAVPQSDRRITVLGVDPADPRTVAELPRWVPPEATGLYRLPTLDRWSIGGADPVENPPGVAFSFVRWLLGDRPSTATLEDATEAAATESHVPARALEPRSRHPAVQRSPWWTVGAWTVTVLSASVPIAAIVLLLVTSGLLVWLLATLLVVGAVALLVGFALTHEAAAIGRTDASIAAAFADAGIEPADGAHPVLVVPARNAAGVAAVLRERGLEAESRGIVPGVEPRTGS